MEKMKNLLLDLGFSFDTLGTCYWLEVLDYMRDKPLNIPMNKILAEVGTKLGLPKHALESQLRRAIDSCQDNIKARFRLAGKVTTKTFLNLMMFEMR